jgi:hypothetical protein
MREITEKAPWIKFLMGMGKREFRLNCFGKMEL